MLIQTLGAILSWIYGHPGAWIPLGYLVASGVAFVLYGWDKLCATKGWWRVRESTLHLCELLGGWPGAAVAQRVFRHKTVKPSFRAEYRLCIFLNLVLLAYLVWGQASGDWTFRRFRGLEPSRLSVGHGRK